MKISFLTVALILCAIGRAHATTLAPGDLLAHDATYDGKAVAVAGTVSDFRSHVSHKGNAYVTFELCASGCIHVFEWGCPSIGEGQALTVHGTFSAVKHVGRYTFYNEIEADDGSP
jgi:hypothetical protein